jgi:hypothetical protein
MDRKTAHNSTFAKWRVEEVLVRSVFNLTFVASRQGEVPKPPIRKSAKRQAVKKPLFSFILSNSTIFKTHFLCLFAF